MFEHAEARQPVSLTRIILKVRLQRSICDSFFLLNASLRLTYAPGQCGSQSSWLLALRLSFKIRAFSK